MDNFAVTTIIYAHAPVSVVIKITTNTPCHLWCYHTAVEPRTHLITRTFRGIAMPWQPYYCFVAWQQTEQLEPGDTYSHTFIVTPWSECEIRWFTFSGTVAGNSSPSVGPIFEHHHPGAIPSSIFLRPNAPGDSCGLHGNPDVCPDNYKNVDDIVADDGSSWVRGQSRPFPFFLLDLYNIETPSESYPIIDFIRLIYRCRRTVSPCGVMVGCKTSGFEFRAPVRGLTTVWTTYQDSWTINPITGNPFTWPEILALQIGLTLARTASGLGWGYCTQIYLEVRYWS